MHEQRVSALRLEARWLYTALFHRQPEEALVTAYVRAHAYYCADEHAARFIRTIVERQLDVESIELVLRTSRPELSRKCRMLVYLAESTPRDYPLLVNERAQPLRAWVALAMAVVRTVFKFAKGHWLVRKHALA